MIVRDGKVFDVCLWFFSSSYLPSVPFFFFSLSLSFCPLFYMSSIILWYLFLISLHYDDDEEDYDHREADIVIWRETITFSPSLSLSLTLLLSLCFYENRMDWIFCWYEIENCVITDENKIRISFLSSRIISKNYCSRINIFSMKKDWR